MSMEIWRCAHKQCRAICFGAGNPLGLRALGWFVHIGPKDSQILCPAHRPDPILCDHVRSPKSRDGKLCSTCAARKQAITVQSIIAKHTQERVA